MTDPQGPLASGSLIPFFRGRAALYHFLDALGVGSGDEVAIQAYTCLAVPLPILALGAKPIYVDINPDDLGMDVEDLRRKIGPKTRAVIIQHTFGIPANAPALTAVAAEAGALVAEDCCHVLEAAVDGRPVGSFGAAAFYSFEWGKPLVAGVGGGIVVHDPELRSEIKARARRLRQPPILQRLVLEAQYWAFRTLLTGRSYWALRRAYNTLSRAGLIVGTFDAGELDIAPGREYHWAMAHPTQERLKKTLPLMDAIIARQRQVGVRYRDAFSDRNIPVWSEPDGREPLYMRFPLAVEDKAAFLAQAREARVEVSGMFKAVIDPLEAVALGRIGYDSGSCPVAERAARHVVSFPTGTRIERRQIERTADFVKSTSQAIVGGLTLGAR